MPHPGQLDEVGILAKLARVASLRRRFSGAFAELVTDGLRLLPDEGPVVEVGAGDGYLTRYLSPRVADRAVLTEATALGCEALAVGWPELDVRLARAESLPLADGSISAWLGCCVLDVLDDPAAGLLEAARVLRPGGLMIHWMDLATDLREFVTEAVGDPMYLVVPNIFTDPLDTTWPEDLFLVSKEQVDRVLAVLPDGPPRRALGGYRDLFERSTDAAMSGLSAVQESESYRAVLFGAFNEAARIAPPHLRAGLRVIQGHPMSSARLFHERILAAWPDELELVFGGLERRMTLGDPELGRLPLEARVGFVRSGPAVAKGLGLAPGSVRLTAHVLVGRRRPPA